MNIPNRFLMICLLISAITVSACGGINRSDKPVVTTWWLDAYEQDAVELSTEPLVKVDVAVKVVPGLDSHRILTLSDHAEMNKYAGARWADSLPELSASLVSRSLEASGRFVVVSRGSGSEDCDLLLEVQEFYARLDSAGQTTETRVAINGSFHCNNEEPKQIRLSASVAVHDDRMKVIVAAFQQSVDEVMKKLLESL